MKIKCAWKLPRKFLSLILIKGNCNNMLLGYYFYRNFGDENFNFITKSCQEIGVGDKIYNFVRKNYF